MTRAPRATCAAAALAACVPHLADGPCPSALVPGDLVITEVFADAARDPTDAGDAADAGKEWLELYNPTARPIALAGLIVTHARADGSRPGSHVIARGEVAPGAYATLGNAADDALPPYLDYGYAGALGGLYNTGGGTLSVRCGGLELDRAPYAGIRAGHARELSGPGAPDYTANDDPAAWCEATTATFAPGNYGTPRAPSDCRVVPAGTCRDGARTRPIVPPAPGDLVITEVMPSPARVPDATGEWLELRARRDVDLNGVAVDRAGDTARPELLGGADCLRVGAGEHRVLARSRDPALNGGLPADAIVGTFRLSLVAGSATAPGDVALRLGDVTLDAVRWTRSATGRALQLDPARTDPLANDDERAFCDATTAYGPASATADRGTPGAANPPCPALVVARPEAR